MTRQERAIGMSIFFFFTVSAIRIVLFLVRFIISLSHSEVDFFNFSLHIMPPMILASLVVWVYIWWVYSGSLKRDPSLRMHEEVEVWKRTLAGLDADNPAEVCDIEILLD